MDVSYFDSENDTESLCEKRISKLGFPKLAHMQPEPRSGRGSIRKHRTSKTNMIDNMEEYARSGSAPGMDHKGETESFSVTEVWCDPSSSLKKIKNIARYTSV